MKRTRTIAATLAVLLAVIMVRLPAGGSDIISPSPDQVVFPGQAPRAVSEGVLTAYDQTLSRKYNDALDTCREMGALLPESPAGPTGEMVIYQVMMLENEDYAWDSEFRDAADRAVSRAKVFAENAPRNDWYYTMLGAAWGIQGIYYLRQDEYLSGLYYGVRGLNHMQKAHEINPENWEAAMGVGLYLYYRSAYSRFIPLPWLDQREKGIELVRKAGENRPYLFEISQIALYYIYMNEEDYDRARSYITPLIEERPDFPVFHHFCGRAMLAKGDLDEAAQHYTDMHEVDADLYLPYYKLAVIRHRQGMDEEAREWLEGFFKTLGDRDSIYRDDARDLMTRIR